MRALVLGGTGMLGHTLASILAPSCELYLSIRGGGERARDLGLLYSSPDRILSDLDISSRQSIETVLNRVRPDVVINCIGIIKQSSAAVAPIECITVNALFPQLLAATAAPMDIRTIQISTDCVFAGTRGNYSETDTPDATDLYGRTKLLGEVSSSRCLTLRTSIIGHELNSKRGLLEWFLSNSGKSVVGFKNAIFSGLSTLELSKVIRSLVLDKPDIEGLYHIAAQAIDKFTLLTMIRDLYRVPIEISPDSTFHCDRSLDGSEFLRVSGIAIATWPQMLEEMYLYRGNI